MLGDHELDMLNDRESVLWTTMLSLAETLGPDLLKLETELAELDTGKVVQERNSGRIINAAAPANRIALKLELLGRTACAEAVPVIDDTITDHLATLRQEDIDQDRQVWNRTLIAAKSALQRLRSSGVDVNHELLD